MEKRSSKLKYDFCFRRWNRKAYSVFNSLRKVIKVGTLAFSFGAAILRPCSVSAQETHTDSLADKEMELEEFVVPAKIAISNPCIVSVLYQTEIEQAAVETLQDLLLYVQGIDIRMRGNNGVQADVSFRGGTFDQITVLLNGINITDPQTGHHSFNIPVPIELIEKIVVYENPFTLTANAVGFTGIIDIITKTPEKNAVDLSLSAGMYGFVRASISNIFRIKKWNFALGGDINKSDGFTDNTDYLHGNAFFSLQYEDKKKGSFDLQGGFQQKNFGANSFYSASYKEQYEQTRVFLASGSYRLTFLEKWQFDANAYMRNHYDHFELFRNEAPTWYAGHNNHQTLVIGANTGISYFFSDKNITRFGIDFRQERLLSNTLGDALPKPVPVSFADETAFYSKHKIRQHIGFQVQEIFSNTWGVHQISHRALLGGKINISNDYGVDGCLGWDGVFYLPKRWELKYLVQNSYRLPTFTDLYYNSPSQKSNPDLQPEQAIASKIGLGWKYKRWTTDLTLFYRYGFRIIDWVRISSDEQWTCQNTTHVQAMGTDVSATYFPKKSYVTRIEIQYSYLFVNKDTQNYHSLYATDYLRHQVKLNVLHRIAWKLYAGWQFNFHSRAGSYLDIQTNTEQPYKAYLLCNLKISLKLEKADIFLEANNLFNQKYFDFGNISQPGIWIKGGIAVQVW
ncbi:MAG: TonB-dependent receptor plug domain-containing protein [Lentimicrobiaceae bacterium]|nr:TonB-dependent receptor plug domain-containing protein [Lentimicrobiaceae bacterium]